jgi:hypothetical protein
MSNASPRPSPDLAAYDTLPPKLRAAVAASPWPVSAVALSRAAGNERSALRRLRELERLFAIDHERVTVEACEQ